MRERSELRIEHRNGVGVLGEEGIVGLDEGRGHEDFSEQPRLGKNCRDAKH